MSGSNYREAGVDIERGTRAVDRIRGRVQGTFNRCVLSDIGKFGGLYALDLQLWKQPVMVASTDGVGTKLMVAGLTGRYDTVGADLVNHCVNDILVQGAQPQFFLDYIGAATMEPDVVESIITGMTSACRENNLCLIGGEMAEMPGIYRKGDFDLVGTIVGLVEKNMIITGEKIVEGDILVGLPSSGLHTNGYSLARHILFDKLGYSVNDIIPESGRTVGEALMDVHRSYYPLLRPWLNPDILHGMAHITGGGIPGNLVRVIPGGLCAQVRTESWEIPPIFGFLQEKGEVETNEMFRVFNMGVGMMLVVPEGHVGQILNATGGWVMGEIVTGTGPGSVELVS